jgi:glutamine synthetase type III
VHVAAFDLVAAEVVGAAQVAFFAGPEQLYFALLEGDVADDRVDRIGVFRAAFGVAAAGLQELDVKAGFGELPFVARDEPGQAVHRGTDFVDDLFL